MTWQAVQSEYVEREHHLRAELASLLQRVQGALERAAVVATVHGRIKSPASAWRKMLRCGLNFEQLYDLIGIRVLVAQESDCYRARDALLCAFRDQPVVEKDFIVRPKGNGYQSLHLRAPRRAPCPFEVQIRTWQMHEQCEQGTAAHWRYKHGQAAVA